jgi:hypothetical protein
LVFRSSMIMLSAASPGALGDYQEGIRHLCEFFPNSWGAIATADEKMRWEHRDRLRETFTSNPPAPLTGARYNPTMPWDFIIGASAWGPPQQPTAYWWDCQVVRSLSSPQSTNSVIAAIEGRGRNLSQSSSSTRQQARGGGGGGHATTGLREIRDGRSHCGKPGHSEADCYQKHGKPDKGKLVRPVGEGRRDRGQKRK